MPTVSPELRKIIVAAIADAADLPPDEVHDDLDLLAMGLDSLDFARILIDIEDSIGDDVPSEVLDRLMELGDVVTIRNVVDLLSTWGPAPSDGGLRPQDEVLVIERP